MVTFEEKLVNNHAIVVIHGANNRVEGVAAEHDYVSQKFGVMGKDFNCIFGLSQGMVGESYPLNVTRDIALITLKDGKEEFISFDISEFYQLSDYAEEKKTAKNNKYELLVEELENDPMMADPEVAKKILDMSLKKHVQWNAGKKYGEKN